MWRLWKSGNRIWFSIGWVFVTLLPVLYVNGVGLNVFAERYLYLPSLGFCWLIAHLLLKVKKRGLATGLALALTALFSARTVARAEVWNNEVDLYTTTLKESPSAAFVHNGFGVVLEEKGRIAEAREEFLTALRLQPGYGDAHRSLADLYSEAGLFDEAIAEFRLALRVNPEDPVLRNHLGYVLHLNGEKEYLKGETDSAITQFNEAIRFKPDLFEAYNKLGMIYFQRGAVEQAIQCYRKCVAIHPACEVSLKLAVLYVQRGLLDDALWELGEAVRREPGCAEAQYDLGVVYSRKGQFDQAIEQFRKFLSIRPDDTEGRASLQAAIERKER